MAETEKNKKKAEKETKGPRDLSEVVKGLKKLGAKAEIKGDGIKITGDWESEYSEYEDTIVEITGNVYAAFEKQDPDSLKNLKHLGSLSVANINQDKNFLKNLKTLDTLYVDDISKQHRDFLKNTDIGKIVQ